MLNTVLAVIAIAAWSATYGLFFARDIRRWWRTRSNRRVLRAMARERAVRAYAVWVQNLPPPQRSHGPKLPVADPVDPVPARAVAVRTGVVVPFPQGRRVSRR